MFTSIAPGEYLSILAKLLYSALLFGLLGVVLRELWTVWFDSTVYIGRFEVVTETGKDDASSAMFPKRIVSSRAISAEQMKDYQTRRAADSPTDATYILPGMNPLLLPQETLGGVEITVQSINLTQLLSVIRKWFLAPNEVTGNVVVRDRSVLAAVEWPRAPFSETAPSRATRFLVPSQTSQQAAAAYIANSLSWAQAASLKAQIASYPKAQFCDFAAGLDLLYALNDKASSPTGLDDNDSALVRKCAAQLRTHYSADAVLPEIYRLRADICELLPEGKRGLKELVEAQEDRLRYAMLSPKFSDLPEEEKRLAALVLARPAILIDDGRLRNEPENWANLLRRHEEEIRHAAVSTGLIVNHDGMPAGTGFIVAPGLMMTARFALRNQQEAAWSPPQKGARLCLGSSSLSPDPALELGDVVFGGEIKGSSIALVKLLNHDNAVHPPLPLGEPVAAANLLTGQYAYVIGYAFPDARVPEEFSKRLLGDQFGHKRLMPGRILAFGQTNDTIGPENEQRPVITNDISTIGGTAGGPLLALSTGQVIGMSVGGKWKGERGKFGYAEPIPKEVREIIGRRLRGEPD